MRYGRMYKGVVVTVAEPPVGRTLEQTVGPSEADEYEEIPDEVGVGHYQQTDGSWLTPSEHAIKKQKALQHVQTPH
jgi:hypothetical protein